MPNWCHNELTITGPPEEISLFLLKWKAHHETFRFQAFVPMPPNLGNGWYDWRVANWGTKWDVEVHDAEIGPGQIRMAFSTAWAPPEPFVEAVSEMFPGLTFHLEHEEPGMAFKGHLTVRDGEVLSQESREMTEEDYPPDENED
jgi:hypothetical protein